MELSVCFRCIQQKHLALAKTKMVYKYIISISVWKIARTASLCPAHVFSQADEPFNSSEATDRSYKVYN